ncbi:hypothetical protein ACWGIN_30910 [Streptomyces sp. NPDC054861]
MKLEDFGPLMDRRRAGGLSYGYGRFRADPAVTSLQWPDDVLEQLLLHRPRGGTRRPPHAMVGQEQRTAGEAGQDQSARLHC